MPSELNFKPAHELASLIRSKKLSPVELLQACLDRIDETEGTLNAWCGSRPEVAMQEAKDLEARIAKGEDAGPLAGLPFGVKELDDLAGFPTTHASKPYRDNYPERDSVEVERLRKAGAIALGKTNSPEFGYTAHHEEPAVRHHAQPLEPGADARRLERRLLGGGVVGAGAVLHGLRRRRQHPHPGLLDGPLRDEGVVRPHPDRAARDAGLDRHVGARADGAHGARRRDVHRRDERHARGRPDFAAATPATTTPTCSSSCRRSCASAGARRSATRSSSRTSCASARRR